MKLNALKCMNNNNESPELCFSESIKRIFRPWLDFTKP